MNYELSAISYLTVYKVIHRLFTISQEKFVIRLKISDVNPDFRGKKQEV